MRRQDTLIHLDDQGEAQYLGYRVKILHSNALQLGNVSITWNPASGAPTVHIIKIYRGGESIDVLGKVSFEILRREDQLDAAKLDGFLTAVLRVPDLRVGDELEVGLTTRVNDPTLGKDSAGLLMLVPNPSPGRYRFGLSWVAGQQPNIKITPDIAPIAKNGERTLEFRFDNPTTLVAPNKAPGRFQWQRIVEYSDFPEWTAISQRFAALYAKAARLNDGSPLKQEAGRIAAAHASPFDRASAALKLVQQDVRYVYVGLNNGNLTPATADETWARRYGDCKGKTALLLALLAELGIEGEPVLVNSAGNDDGLDERLPSPRMFDHVFVRARINGAIYYLDGTLPPVVPPGKSPVFPVRWILPLTNGGNSIEHLEWSPPKNPDEIKLFEIDATKGFTEPAHITSTSIVRGIPGLQQQIQFSGLAPGELLNGARQNWIGDTWQTIDNVQWRFDQRAQASVLTISGTGKIDWDDDGDGARSLALPGGGFSPPERRVRAADQNQSMPFYNKPEFSCYVTTVRLPATTRSKQWSSKPEYDAHIFGQNYYRAFDLRAGTIRMIRGFRVEQQEIDAATARRDNDRIAAFDNSMAWIYFAPAGQGTPVGSGKNVPATYDTDWTVDNVPCLSTAARDKPVAAPNR
ncbi:MAG: DUF3857 domain-containing protein [Novosphingobium sp.]